MASNDRYEAMEENYSGYQAYDQDGEKIGKIDDIFLDENDQPEYFGVKMGFLGTKSTLIPAEITQASGDRRIVVSQPKSMIKDGPVFEDDRELTPEYEQQVRTYYGLGSSGYTADRGSYESYESSSSSTTGYADRETTAGASGVTSEREGTTSRSGSDRDELRVQRSEEELRAGVREHEAGAVKVRKRVRTDRERIAVPKRREEVSVERVPVDGTTTGAEIGEDEIVVPVVEEEVVVEKRAVVKEELKINKDVVEEEEVVEADVRREEIDIEDTSTTGTTGRGNRTDIDDSGTTGTGRRNR